MKEFKSILNFSLTKEVGMKKLMRILVVVVFVVSVVLPLFGQPSISYQQCVWEETLDWSKGFFYVLACVISGYVPAEMHAISIAVFFIFGVIIPIGMLIALFYDFTPDTLIKNKNAKAVIAISAAFLAYRGGLSTAFIEVLTYGFLGVGALMVSTLFVGWISEAVDRWCGFEVWEVEKKIERRNLEERLADIDHRLDVLWERMGRYPPGSERANEIYEQIQALEETKKKLLKEYSKSKV